MQFAKDSFYMALRSRLAGLNPARVVMIEGVAETAVLVTENEAVTSAERHIDCFYISFGAANPAVASAAAGLMSLETNIEYQTRGTADDCCDRGRSLAALDSELLGMLPPTYVAKSDYTKNPALGLGTNLFWAKPRLGQVEATGRNLRRTATLTIYFYPEDAEA